MFGKRSYFWGHCGAEHQCLTLFRKEGNDLHDVIMETYVKHPVCFVKHKHLQLRELYITEVEM